MDVKSIIDKHFTANYSYYKSVCFRYYRGRYLHDDLLNEAYIKFLEVPKDVIEKFNDINKLHCIGLKVIRSLYQKRIYPAKNKHDSSPLFETPSLNYDLQLVSDEQKNEIEIQTFFEKAVKVIEQTLQEPVNESKKSDWLKVSVFMDLQDSNPYRLSKQTGISRQFITKTYNEGRDLIRQKITNE